MNLSAFIEGLRTDGAVRVAGEMTDFAEEDLQATARLLQQCHEQDLPEMPGTVPDFDAEAALWAAQYLYRAVQLIMLRNLGEEVIDHYLTPYGKELSPESIYSVDLCFRHLPSLLALANGLAPDDPLVVRLKETAKAWPFSSAGLEATDTPDITMILGNDSLRHAYIDRIIESRNIKKAGIEPMQSLVREALGNHAAILWPEFTVSI